MRALFRWSQLDIANGWTRDADAKTADGQPALALLGPIMTPAMPFLEAIPSWSAATPGASWIEVELRVQHAGRWSRFYRIARWDDRLEASTRRSFEAQRDDDGRVATDTLVANMPSEAVQPRVLLVGTPAPLLRSFTIALSGPGGTVLPQALPAVAEIVVPLRSQMIYSDGGDGWCSPTSVTMLLAYWHARTGDKRLVGFHDLSAVPERMVKLTYDPTYDGTGNWIFNTAAASLWLESYVARFSTLADLTPWLQTGVPVIISIAWQPGELDNAPLLRSNGHLIVVTGFDGDGAVFVADPAGHDATQVRRRYQAAQLEAAWQRNSDGTVYLIYPHDWPRRSI